VASEQAIAVRGHLLDNHTRCRHYHSSKDIIAIRMKCCNEYYACIDCHNEQASHAAQVWTANEYAAKAVLCGACYSEMTISEYLQCNNQCPCCNADFNPACSNHYHYYFEMDRM
jgi:uncharacterized CHY-type Zn-finger protein